MPNFNEFQRRAASLLPASVDGCVLEDHLACFTFDSLDLTALAARHSGRGRGGVSFIRHGGAADLFLRS